MLRQNLSISAVILIFVCSFALWPRVAPGQSNPADTNEIIAKTTNLTAQAGGASLGEATPATPVTIVSTAGDTVEIAIEGWSMHDAPQYLYPDIGQRIILVTLEQSGQDARAVVTSQADKYGIAWDNVKVTGWVPAANLATDPAAVWQAAQAIFQKRCSACHALHQPKEFTANQWPSILKIMTKRAALSPADTELVTKYLQLHAKIPGAGNGPGPNAGPKARLGSGNGPKR